MFKTILNGCCKCSTAARQSKTIICGIDEYVLKHDSIPIFSLTQIISIHIFANVVVVQQHQKKSQQLA